MTAYVSRKDGPFAFRAYLHGEILGPQGRVIGRISQAIAEQPCIVPGDKLHFEWTIEVQEAPGGKLRPEAAPNEEGPEPWG
jgi:hypothetical protein